MFPFFRPEMETAKKNVLGKKKAEAVLLTLCLGLFIACWFLLCKKKKILQKGHSNEIPIPITNRKLEQLLNTAANLPERNRFTGSFSMPLPLCLFPACLSLTSSFIFHTICTFGRKHLCLFFTPGLFTHQQSSQFPFPFSDPFDKMTNLFHTVKCTSTNRVKEN